MTLNVSEIPSHNHDINSLDGPGSAGTSGGNFLAGSASTGRGSTADTPYDPMSDTTLNTGALTSTGGGQGHKTTCSPFWS